MNQDSNNNVEDDGTEVEVTTGEDDVNITKPFDPSKIRISTKQDVLQNIIERLEHNEINLTTDFQRLPNLWGITKQSRLIESILLRLPLPAFYFDGNNDNKWDVVDGLQRISAIRNFVLENTLKLSGLEFLKELEGKTYKELSRTLQRRIKSFPIVAHIIEAGTPDDVKYNIFKRINTGGLVLTPQEIRHALNQGIPAKFIEELAKLKNFRKATDYKIRQKRMQDRDFINRFIAFYILGYEGYEPDLDGFMNLGMAAVKKIPKGDRVKLKQRFIQAMDLAYYIFKYDAFRKRLNWKDKRKPINKALFDCLSVCFAALTENQALIIENQAKKFKELFLEKMHDSNFYKALTHGTSHKWSVKTRFETIISILKNILGDAYQVTNQ